MEMNICANVIWRRQTGMLTHAQVKVLWITCGKKLIDFGETYSDPINSGPIPELVTCQQFLNDCCVLPNHFLIHGRIRLDRCCYRHSFAQYTQESWCGNESKPTATAIMHYLSDTFGNLFCEYRRCMFFGTGFFTSHRMSTLAFTIITSASTITDELVSLHPGCVIGERKNLT